MTVVMTVTTSFRKSLWARMAGPHALRVAATFRLISVTTDLATVSTLRNSELIRNEERDVDQE